VKQIYSFLPLPLGHSLAQTISGDIMKNDMTIGTNFLTRALLAVLVIGLLTSHGKSQTTTAHTLRLSVVDAQGVFVPGALVVLERNGSQQELIGVTTEDGTVTFENLEPGTSKVTVKAMGFVTLEKSVTIAEKQINRVTLSVAPRTITSVAKRSVSEPNPPPALCAGQTCVKDEINSLWLPIPLRIARLFQYEYKLTETPGTVQVGSEFIQNPQDELHQHTINLKVAELFPDRLTMFKRGSEYLKRYPLAAVHGDKDLAEAVCDDNPLITCMTKGGNWFKRAWMGTTVSLSLSQRSLVQQQILVAPKFSTKYQFAGGFVFDPAKIFPSVSSWRAMFDEVARIDKALALIGAHDVDEKRAKPWNRPWSVIFPKVEFKILTQFDFVKVSGVLVEAPFPERALNTWTFTWDLSRLIPDTRNRVDEEAIYEAIGMIKETLGKPDGWKKNCVIRKAGEANDRTLKDIHPAFSAESCQETAQIMKAQTYKLSCVLAGSPNDDGAAVPVGTAPTPAIKPPNNLCNW
jgi:hypothetical protein